MAKFEINDFNPAQNMFIEASAGTGKTYTIQQIVAKLLEENKSDPDFGLEKILILTFTEKAAGELKDRIRAKLEECKMTKALEVVDNAPISTFHSFCQRITEEFPINANLCTNLKLIGKGEVYSFAEKYIRDYLPKNEQYYKDALLLTNNEIASSLEDYLITLNNLYYLDKNNQEVTDFIVADKGNFDLSIIKDLNSRFSEEEKFLYGYEKVENDNNIVFLLNFFDKFYDKSITDDITKVERTPKIIDLMYAIKTELENALQSPQVENNQKTKTRVEANLSLFNNGYVDCFNHLLKAGKGDNNFGLTNQMLEVMPAIEPLLAAFEELKEKYQGMRDYIRSNYLDYLIDKNLRNFYTGWMQEKTVNKCQTFDDMIRNIREAVCDSCCDLKDKLKAKYKYAIIDEFQDTNQKQWDIFSHIFMEDNDHAIYVVGDPKQSIYAFQGADVKVYSKATEEIAAGTSSVTPGQDFNLDTNWRSTKPMIKACNAFFRAGFFSDGDNIIFEDSKDPDPENVHPENVRPNPEYDGKPAKPIWAPIEQFETNEKGNKKALTINVEEYAYFIAERIIDFCKVDSNGKTKLQIYKKGSNGYEKSNLQLSDIAILCQSRGQIDSFKKVFEEIGLPATHYKESCLFQGKECLEWISILSAINAEDFTGSNRKILSEALFTEFFGIKMEKIQDQKYDRPDCKERTTILKWNQFAKKRMWAALKEKIFEDTQIETKLSEFNQLRHLSILRQIADYWVNYLYENNCSLTEVIENLTLLANQETDAEEDDDNLVAKGSDFNVVQMMTIHASKGLQFPIVITAVGFGNIQNKYSYIYHDDKGTQHLCANSNSPSVLGDTAGELAKEERELEIQRILYVDYTRAESMMFLPLNTRIKKICRDKFNASELGTTLRSELVNEEYDYVLSDNIDDKYKDSLRLQVADLIKTQNPEKPATSTATEDSQKTAVEELKKDVDGMNAYKLSYSTLTHSSNASPNKSKIQKDKPDEFEEIELDDLTYTKIDLSEFDKNSKPVECEYTSDESSITKIISQYPKGTAVGEAVHQIFEYSIFNKVGNASVGELCASETMDAFIKRRFAGQGMNLENDSFGIKDQTVNILWNTLNAVLPEIKANCSTGKNFSLKEINENERKAEAEFNMLPDIPHNATGLHDYFNGFIDLMFVREVDGNPVYSIADWKTDTFEAPVDYADAKIIKTHTDEHYSIQRVLYSYCLIKWLKQFYEGTEQEIFEKYFGGIYYVYVKGCKAGTGNGIYGQTWENWESLEKAFNLIVQEKLPNKAGEN